MSRLLLQQEFVPQWQRDPYSFMNFSSNNPPPSNPIQIYAIDPPGGDNLNYVYTIQGFDLTRNVKYMDLNPPRPIPTSFTIVFDGFPNTDRHHPTGVTNDTLIEIVIDRLMSQQSGPAHNNYIIRALSQLRMTLSLFKEMRRYENSSIANKAQTINNDSLGGNPVTNNV